MMSSLLNNHLCSPLYNFQECTYLIIAEVIVNEQNFIPFYPGVALA